MVMELSTVLLAAFSIGSPPTVAEPLIPVTITVAMALPVGALPATLTLTLIGTTEAPTARGRTSRVQNTELPIIVHAQFGGTLVDVAVSPLGRLIRTLNRSEEHTSELQSLRHLV